MSNANPYRNGESVPSSTGPKRVAFEALADDEVFWSAIVLKRIGRSGASSDKAAEYAADVADQVLELRRIRFAKMRST